MRCYLVPDQIVDIRSDLRSDDGQLVLEALVGLQEGVGHDVSPLQALCQLYSESVGDGGIPDRQAAHQRQEAGRAQPPSAAENLTKWRRRLGQNCEWVCLGGCVWEYHYFP